MLLKILILFIPCLQSSGHQQSFLKIVLSEIVKTNITTCDDVKSVFDPKSDPKESNGVNKTADVFHYISTLMRSYNDKSELNKFSSKQFFGNNSKAELLIARIFEKLVDIKTTKLSKVVLALEEQKQINADYYLLNAFDVVYSSQLNPKVNDMEKFLSEKLWSRVDTDIGKTNYGYFESFTGDELRSHAHALLCTFQILANHTSNHAISELLETFESVLDESNVSKPMLTFVNKLLTESMEGNYNKNASLALFKEYITSCLESLGSFDKSELDDIQNLDEDHFRELERTNSQGILALVLDWKLQMQEKFNKSSILKYFCIMDETFRQVVKRRNEFELPALSYRIGEDPKKTALMKRIQDKLSKPVSVNSHLQKLLDNMRGVIKNGTNVQLLVFIEECLDQIRNHSRLNLMPPIFNYIRGKLSVLEPLNETEINRFQENNVEQIAAILDEYSKRAPQSIVTMGLDWLLDFKIQLLTKSKTTTLFDILQNSFEDAMKRRELRVKNMRGKVPRIPDIKSKQNIRISPEDERKLLAAAEGYTWNGR